MHVCVECTCAYALCLCMPPCMYVCVCVCMRACAVCVCVCVCVCVYACVHAFVCLVHAHMFMLACMHVCMCCVHACDVCVCLRKCMCLLGARGMCVCAFGLGHSCVRGADQPVGLTPRVGASGLVGRGSEANTEEEDGGSPQGGLCLGQRLARR